MTLRSVPFQLLPCERLLELGKEFLPRKQSMADMNNLNPKSLFAQIKKTDVQLVLQEEMTEITELEEQLTKAMELRFIYSLLHIIHLTIRKHIYCFMLIYVQINRFIFCFT